LNNIYLHLVCTVLTLLQVLRSQLGVLTRPPTAELSYLTAPLYNTFR
jgi:hypothetical protein